ncbi:septation protein SpoVG [Anoxybacter fermentans]|uniref:Septation protein SpoVG n=1 Tax=Anoxybacter fermentans TaxID=1323375 RepID=A0A3Q9HSX8_9FIRM|nr:septation regulator SpoVG [Anoxybacter fermentans]AZR74953.1 septation protein SpoVG [Anoxybacter fermentans]
MKITEVKVRKIERDGKFLAYATITIDDCFVVKDLKVVKGKNGLFVAMPSRKKSDGEYIDIAHPITSEARELIQRAVLEEYKSIV